MDKFLIRKNSPKKPMRPAKSVARLNIEAEDAQADREEAATEADVTMPPAKRRREHDGSNSVRVSDALQKRIMSQRVMYVEDETTDRWPDHTSELCKWDLQPFTGFPVGIPVHYDEKRRKYWLFGYFCSINCAMAYAIENDRSNKMTAALRLFTRDLYGVDYRRNMIRAAAPREKLSTLYATNGCDMKRAVAEFRRAADFTEFKPDPSPFVRVTKIIEEVRYEKAQAKKHEEHIDSMAQRPKPMVLTQRGRMEQQRYVVKRTKPHPRNRGVIENILKIKQTDV